MVMIVLFVIVSYVVFSMNNLAGSAQIAEAYSSNDYDFQTSFSRTSNNINDIMAYSNLLDKGELVVRNPNKTAKAVKVVLIIEDASKDDFDGLEIKFNDETVDLSKMTTDGVTYKIELNDISIDAYENFRGVIAFYGAPSCDDFNYSFQVSENL